jgi:hypothetical protein
MFFTSEIVPNLNLKNMISTFTVMNFSNSNQLKLSDFDGFFPNCQNCMMGSSDCQECRSILNFFLPSYLVHSLFFLFSFSFGWMIASLAKSQNFQKKKTDQQSCPYICSTGSSDHGTQGELVPVLSGSHFFKGTTNT